MARRIVGVDIGFNILRAAQVRFQRGDHLPIVEKLAERRLPPGVVEYGDVLDGPALVRELAEFWREAGFKSKHVALAASNLHVFAREMAVPVMSAQRIRESLPFMMEGILPVAPDQLYLDFYPVEQHVDETGQSYMGLAVAAERKSIDDMTKCVTDAGLRPMQVDFAPFALMRARGLASKQDEVCAYIDIGAGSSIVIIARGQVPLFVRIIPNGGNDIDDALVFNLKVTNDEAAKIKMDMKEKPKSGDDLHAWDLIQAASTDLLSAVKSTFDYFAQSHAKEPIPLTQVVLSGGGAHTPGITEAIAAISALPVEVDGNVSGVEWAHNLQKAKHKTSDMALAIGLALGRGQDGY